jgi:hypothetical protein
MTDVFLKVRREFYQIKYTNSLHDATFVRRRKAPFTELYIAVSQLRRGQC